MDKLLSSLVSLWPVVLGAIIAGYLLASIIEPNAFSAFGREASLPWTPLAAKHVADVLARRPGVAGLAAFPRRSQRRSMRPWISGRICLVALAALRGPSSIVSRF
jgi:hypothetical protein